MWAEPTAQTLPLFHAIGKIHDVGNSLPLQREWSNLAQAEAAERQRREVVREVAPIAQSAEEREVEAFKLRRLAEDTNYHAEVGASLSKQG